MWQGELRSQTRCNYLGTVQMAVAGGQGSSSHRGTDMPDKCLQQRWCSHGHFWQTVAENTEYCQRTLNTVHVLGTVACALQLCCSCLVLRDATVSGLEMNGRPVLEAVHVVVRIGESCWRGSK